MGKRGPKPRNREFVWTPELAYVVGLIATDGCLSNDQRHLLFVSKDLEQILNLKKCLNLKVKIGVQVSGRRHGNREYHRIQWGDVRFYQFLVGIGLTSRKSLTMGTLLVPDEFFFDFLRGAFDGDGSFYSYFDPRWKSSFMFYLNFTSASPAHITWLRQTIERLVSVRGHVSRMLPENQRGSGIETLRYAKKDTLILLRYMYANKGSAHLERKRLKIEEALRIVGKSLHSKEAKTLTNDAQVAELVYA